MPLPIAVSGVVAWATSVYFESRRAANEEQRIALELGKDKIEIINLVKEQDTPLALDSSLRDVKQDDSNNEVAASGGGEQIDDILDGLVGAVVGDFESAVWAILRVRTAVEAAVGKWSAQPFVEEQK